MAHRDHNRTKPIGRLLGGAMRSFVGLATIATVACAPQVEERVGSTVRVRPQVVIDGLVELTAQTEGEIFVDEVLLHAPEVDAIEHGERTDLLRTDPIDPGALFFRFDLDDPEGSALRSERRWALRGCGDEAEVVFGFSPLVAGDAQLAQLESRTATELDSLNGYTALVHGFVAVEVEQGTALKSVLNVSGDPDGMPAEDPEAPSPGGLEQSGDPDGMPAEGDPDGMPADASGDPDGMPADVAAGDPDGMPADGDPDGMPADGDPDGMPADGDPDGMPADGDPDGMPADLQSGELGERTSSLVRSQSRMVLKPFVLVIPAAMELSLPVASLNVDTTEEDAFLPIDLHIDIGALLSQSVINRLRQVTTNTEPDEEASIVVRDVSGVFDIVTRRVKTAVEEESKLRNISDAR